MVDAEHRSGPLGSLVGVLPPALRRSAETAALTAFRSAPAPLRRALVRAGTPAYTVGAVCVLDHRGSLLLLRQPHRTGWSLPGGLLDRGEGAAAGVEREVREETGLEVRVGPPLTVLVEPGPRRVDVVFRVVVDERPDVVPGGEARGFAWLTPQEVLGDADGPTRSILAGVRAALDGDARGGRLLPRAP